MNKPPGYKASPYLTDPRLVVQRWRGGWWYHVRFEYNDEVYEQTDTLDSLADCFTAVWAFRDKILNNHDQ